MPRVEQAGSEGPPPPFPGRTGRSRENTISIDTPGMGLTTAYLFWTSSPGVPGTEDPGGSTACAMARKRRFSRMQVIEKLSHRGWGREGVSLPAGGTTPIPGAWAVPAPWRCPGMAPGRASVRTGRKTDQETLY